MNQPGNGRVSPQPRLSKTSGSGRSSFQQLPPQHSILDLMILYTPTSKKFCWCLRNLGLATGLIGIISLLGEFVACFILQVVQHKLKPTYFDFLEEADYPHIPGNIAFVHEFIPAGWLTNLPWFTWTIELLVMQTARFLFSTCLCFILAFGLTYLSFLRVYIFLNVVYYLYCIGVHVLMLIYMRTTPGRVQYVVTWTAWYFVAFHFWCVVVTYYRIRMLSRAEQGTPTDKSITSTSI